MNIYIYIYIYIYIFIYIYIYIYLLTLYILRADLTVIEDFIPSSVYLTYGAIALLDTCLFLLLSVSKDSRL